MLIAENQLQEKINLVNFTREEIEGLKKSLWFCPGCQRPLQIKNGSIRRPHFSHQQHEKCVSFSENESEEHLAGKILIAQNCETFDLPYELEAYLPEIQQRPDVLINQQIAIEFQCSSLSLERFKERSLNYQQHEYDVIWVVGKNFHLKKQASILQRNFMYLTSNLGFHFWELDVLTEEVILKYFILNVSSHLIAKERRWSLKTTSLLDIWRFMTEVSLQTSISVQTKANYNKQLFKWNQELNLKQPKVMKLQAFFYQEGQNLRELSPFTALPSYFTPLLMKEELILRHYIQSYFQEYDRGNIQEIGHYVKEKMADEVLDYVLVGADSLLTYCVSLSLYFLREIGRVTKKKENYYLNKKILRCPEIEAETLWLPLKYVMINK